MRAIVVNDWQGYSFARILTTTKDVFKLGSPAAQRWELSSGVTIPAESFWGCWVI